MIGNQSIQYSIKNGWLSAEKKKQLIQIQSQRPESNHVAARDGKYFIEVLWMLVIVSICSNWFQRSILLPRTTEKSSKCS